MKTSLILTASAALLIVGGHNLFAQETALLFQAAPAPRDVILGPAGPLQGPGMSLIAIEPFGTASPVRNAPYTADAITETTQVLADGNRIEQRTSAAIARDSSGRVRRQQDAVTFGGLVAKSPAPLVTISDPSGDHITLDTERRMAYRIRIPPPPPDAALGPRTARVGGGARGEFEVAVPPPLRGDVADGRPAVQFTIRQERGARVAQGSVVVNDPAMFSLTGPPETDSRVEPLGTRDIEGVRAEGTRTTITIPANAIGNQAPIAVVNERWFSPELQVVVMTRRSDPRFGETVYRLVNIVRAEPPADLFEIPGDYRVEDQPRPPR